ncbi:hypothetical protein C8J57DRAFT_1247612 [Mycena rebaudengoi]|nr:hypothetical protein C8J57DRAFT_1247612 [Mycena rebaudengoi]
MHNPSPPKHNHPSRPSRRNQLTPKSTISGMNFLSVDAQDIWESLEEFKPAKTYNEFKRQSLSFIPAPTPIGDYSQFYQKFLVITKYLISKGRLSPAEQSRSFRRAVTPQSLWNQVHQRLQIKHPDVHPQDPYEFKDLHEAVEFQQLQQAQSHPHTPPSQNSNPSRTDGWSYCSELDHFIAKCPHVAADINAGKCKHDVDGRVVLPSGAFVPRRISGRNLREHIEEWHRQNPGQLAAAQLLLEVATQHLSALSGNAIATFQLTDEERLKSLEHEMFALRTHAQARRALAAGEPEEQPEHSIPPPAATSSKPAPPSSAQAPATPGILRPKNIPAPASPEHPFLNSRDAAYAPPRDRNVGARPEPSHTKKSKPAYRTTAPIFDEKIASKVFDRSMDIPVTVTQRELLSLSPEVRAKVRDATTSRRVVPNEEDNATNNSVPPVQQFNMDLPVSTDIFYDSLEQQKHEDERMTAFFDSMPSSFVHAAQPAPDLPADAFVVPDPYETFYNSGEIPDDLVVSMESTAIRSILPVVDNRNKSRVLLMAAHKSLRCLSLSVMSLAFLTTHALC